MKALFVFAVCWAAGARFAAAQNDPELAGLIEKAFSGDPARVIPDIFKQHSLPTTAQVGDEAAYLFVYLAMQGPPAFRSRVLGRVREAAARGDIPADALVFAEARDRLERIHERADREPPSNPELRDEIERIFVPDQAVRQNAGFDLQKMMEMDQRHAGALREMVERYGAPTYAMVGTKAAGDFVVLVQHQPAELRKLVLPKLKANVDAGQADPDGYAMMYDRSLIDQGKKQFYGKNLGCGPDGRLQLTPIEDEAHVNQRLAEMGVLRAELYARLAIQDSADVCRHVAGK